MRYPFGQRVPGPGEVMEVAEGVLWVRMPLPFALDHINLWVLRDGDGWTVVDCGYAGEATQGAWEALLRGPLQGRPVCRVIVTHYHPDHLGMASWLTRRFGVELWMTQAEYLTAHAVWDGRAGLGKEALVALYRRHGLDEERLRHLTLKGETYRRGVPEVPVTYRRLMDGEAIRIDGRQWIVHVGYGHAPEHAALYCESLNAFVSGDMVLPRISTNVSVWSNEPEGDPLGFYLESLARYRALPQDTWVLPSHGLVFTGLRERIDALYRHHAERLEALRAACAEPRTVAEVIPVLFRRPLDAHQSFFAMGEALAHLNYLWRRGEVERSLGPHGVYRFWARAPQSSEARLAG
ncbi:MBL fold metallo-hydrolase [Pelomicrobium methylotrophicum]|uniref:MBL fold metallo-hydrolase n=1 Tax=Pelomicrobium methylotrophicum TaxID=2602750 RepID=UPI001969E94A|nr:MBL fold metallo-hydrolase [Pelomicrobium methylotrophicum]